MSVCSDKTLAVRMRRAVLQRAIFRGQRQLRIDLLQLQISEGALGGNQRLGRCHKFAQQPVRLSEIRAGMSRGGKLKRVAQLVAWSRRELEIPLRRRENLR